MLNFDSDFANCRDVFFLKKNPSGDPKLEVVI